MTEDIASSNGNGAAASATAMDISPIKTKPELKDALNYIIHGKRHLLVHDYNSAVTSLEEATRMFDQIYGPGADECGDAYLYYGIASLELARQETGALDGVISANIHESSDEDDGDDNDDGEDGDEEAEGEGEQENQENAKASPAVEMVEGAKTDGEDIDSEEEKPASTAAKSEATSSSSNGNGSSAVDAAPGPSVDPQPGTSNGQAGEEEEEEGDTEATTAEIAWEVLNLAREVFQRQLHKGSEMKVKLAESLQKLGEISIEWENYVNAIDILQECLSLRKEILPDDDRLIAETYYHIGISFSFSNECEKANDCFRSAISVIEQRLKNLRASTADTAEPTEEKSQKELEIIELESLLPEMTLKIEDSSEQMVHAIAAMKEESKQEIANQVLALKIKDVPDKPVNDISHLMKRKRTDSGDPSSKKVCAGDAPQEK